MTSQARATGTRQRRIENAGQWFLVVVVLCVEFECRNDGEHVMFVSVAIVGGEDGRTSCERVRKCHRNAPILRLRLEPPVDFLAVLLSQREA